MTAMSTIVFLIGSSVVIPLPWYLSIPGFAVVGLISSLFEETKTEDKKDVV